MFRPWLLVIMKKNTATETQSANFKVLTSHKIGQTRIRPTNSRTPKAQAAEIVMLHANALAERKPVCLEWHSVRNTVVC